MKRQYKRARANKNAVSSRVRGLRLLPYTIRENLPILGTQRRLGGRVKALAKWFLADGSLTWYVTEGSARRNLEGKAVDYLLYGLIVGQSRRLDYFWLSDFTTDHGPSGLPVERDLHWQPKTLDEIAPEMFQSPDNRAES